MKCSLHKVAALLAVLLCSNILRAKVVEDHFGTLADGTEVRRWTISNSSGASASLISYGATLVSLNMPDRNGTLDDIVLGFDQLEPYLTKSPYFGAIVGRYANRINAAHFTLDGVEYHTTANNEGNTLHGGLRGFDKVLWTGTKIDDQTVEFSYLSKDGEEGFPGNLTTHVRYSLSNSNELKIEYSLTTDKDTVVNVTNHSYFNLAGAGSADILQNVLTIDADQYTPTTPRLIPTGEISSVINTPFDFRLPHVIGQRIEPAGNPDGYVPGYDLNYVLRKQDSLHHAATVYEPTTGRVLDIWTTEPGLQLYTSNGLDGTFTGKAGKIYPKFGAIALETQHFPDSPNEPTFPTTVLKAGQTYRSTSAYRFTTQSVAAASTQPIVTGIDLSTGWSLIKEGQAQGTAQEDAHSTFSSAPNQLRIEVTKTAEPAHGRVGAISDVPIPADTNEWFDIRFAAMSERSPVGMVFSLEGADGTVLARATLPAIGQGRRRFATTAPTPRLVKYRVVLHTRAGDPQAHLVITPIEPAVFWIQGMTITPR